MDTLLQLCPETITKGDAVELFYKKHKDKITGILSCFNRILFRGYLPIGYPQAMEDFMNRRQLLLRDLSLKT